jgi:WD40 repeat protein
LYLADLEAAANNSNEPMGPMDSLKHVHASHLEESVDVNETPPHLNEALEVLYGNYDGGGVMAIAVKKDFVVSSGREGGVHVCSIVGSDEDVYKGSRGGRSSQTKLMLQPLGRLRGLEDGSSFPPLITSLAFDNLGTLWVAGYDGILRGYDYEQTDADDQPLMLRQKHADHKVNVNSPIISVSIQDEIGCGVLTTVSKGIVLFSLEDGHILAEWNPYASSKRGEFARSAMIVQTDEPQPLPNKNENNGSSNGGYEQLILPSSHWSVVVGGSKGTLYQRRLGIHSHTGFISEHRPLMDNIDDGTEDPRRIERIRPNHLGPIVAMASPYPGLLITGSHDGTMRVWDCSLYKNDDDDDEDEDDHDDYDIETITTSVRRKLKSNKRPRVLYALSGYKVWLGSIFANDRKLVSDGADNSIIVHSYDEDPEDVLRSREEDDDDAEDFTFD